LLEPVERFVLLDDTWAGLLAGQVELSAVEDLLRAVDPTDEATVWRRAAAMVSTLRLIGGPGGADRVAGLAVELAEPGLADTSDLERRAVQFRIAGVTGRWAPAVAQAREVVSGDAPSQSDSELVAAAVDVVAANGDADDFDRFVDLYRNGPTPQEVQRYLAALTRFSDPVLFQQLLEMCLDEVRSQNAPYTLGQAMANPENGGTAWAFVRDNWDTITTQFPSNSIVRLASGIRTLFDPDVAADVLAFFAEHEVPQALKTMSQHLEMVRVNQALRARVAPTVEA
jgi:puromycin-sensitive aminopeptidase